MPRAVAKAGVERDPDAQLRAMLGKLDAKRQKLVWSLRTALRKRFPTYNELAYAYPKSVVIAYSPNHRGIDAPVSIAARADRVDLYFNHGPELSDPKKLLSGAGRQTRFIQIEAASQLATADVARFIATASRLAVKRKSGARAGRRQNGGSRKPVKPSATPASAGLEKRVRTALAGTAKVKERRMFGGIGFMVKGHLCVTARPTRIMCRIDPADHDAAIERKGSKTVIMRGRKYRGFVHIEASALKTQPAVAAWVRQALAFNRTLPERRK